MAQRGSVTDKGRSLNSIKLKDFPENQGLARDFTDREYEEDFDDVTTIIPRSEIPEDEDGTDGLMVRSLSSLFDDDDISSGDTTLISKEELDEALDKKAAPQDSSQEPVVSEGPSQKQTASKAVSAGSTVSAKKKKAPGKGQISRNPQAQTPKKTKQVRQPKVQDFGTKRHSVAYRVIKVCIILLVWIAIAFACYQLYKFAYSVINDQPMDSTDASKIQITVTGDESDEEMGEMLKSYGLISDVGIYKWRCKLYTSDYVPGTYKLSRSYNTEKILNILAGYNYSDGTLEDETEEES